MNPYVERIEAGDCALILIDIQQSMLQPCVAAEAIEKNADALLEFCGAMDIPVLFSTHNGSKLGGFLPALTGKIPSPATYDKTEFSCLENEGLATAINSLGRRTLLLAGLEAHVCVMHTCLHALKLGYRVHVAADAVSSRSALNVDLGLRRMEKAGAVLSSTEMMIFEILQRAGTPEFRKVLPLLKSLS